MKKYSKIFNAVKDSITFDSLGIKNLIHYEMSYQLELILELYDVKNVDLYNATYFTRVIDDDSIIVYIFTTDTYDPYHSGYRHRVTVGGIEYIYLIRPIIDLGMEDDKFLNNIIKALADDIGFILGKEEIEPFIHNRKELLECSPDEIINTVSLHVMIIELYSTIYSRTSLLEEDASKILDIISYYNTLPRKVYSRIMLDAFRSSCSIETLLDKCHILACDMSFDKE